MRSMTRAKASYLFQKNPQPIRVGLATLGLSLSAWFATTRVFSEEIQILETEDNLIEGEVRELLVGPKP